MFTALPVHTHIEPWKCLKFPPLQNFKVFSWTTMNVSNITCSVTGYTVPVLMLQVLTFGPCIKNSFDNLYDLQDI